MEFGFELALCSQLEATTDWVLARQLGAAVAEPGSRVIDVCGVLPNDRIDERARITPQEIPLAAIESDVGAGEAVYWRDAFDCHPERARRATERAIEIGFFEAERRNGRRYVRQTTRYPDWADRLVGIENKPRLDSPGDLERQLRFDVSLALFDEVILATQSHVTRAHLNRIPEAVGVWRFDPDDGSLSIVREPTPLRVDEPGIEPIGRRPLRTDVAMVSPAEKRRYRRRIAERAYGKGWRTYELPACDRLEPTADGRPWCNFHDRVVEPAAECGPDCPGHEPIDPDDRSLPDLEALREERTPWVADPDGLRTEQSGLSEYL